MFYESCSTWTPRTGLRRTLRQKVSDPTPPTPQGTRRVDTRISQGHTWLIHREHSSDPSHRRMLRHDVEPATCEAGEGGSGSRKITHRASQRNLCPSDASIEARTLGRTRFVLSKHGAPRPYAYVICLISFHSKRTET